MKGSLVLHYTQGIQMKPLFYITRRGSKSLLSMGSEGNDEFPSKVATKIKHILRNFFVCKRIFTYSPFKKITFAFNTN